VFVYGPGYFEDVETVIHGWQDQQDQTD